MTPAEAKRAVQSVKDWKYYEPQETPLQRIAPMNLQTHDPKITREVYEALGLSSANGEFTLVGSQTGGSSYVSGFDAIAVLAEAGAPFPERNQFLTGRAITPQ